MASTLLDGRPGSSGKASTPCALISPPAKVYVNEHCAMWAFSEGSSAGSVTTQNTSKRPTFSFPLSLYSGAFTTRISPWLRPCAPRSSTFSSAVLVETVRVLRPSLSLWSSLLLDEADDTAPRTPIIPSAITTRKSTTVLLNTTFLYSSSLKRGETRLSVSPAPFDNGASLHIQGRQRIPKWRVFVLLRRCLQVANFVELHKAEVQLPRIPKRRSSQNSPSEAVWKFSGTCQASHHQTDHGRVDERFCASTKPLVVFAHPPVLA